MSVKRIVVTVAVVLGVLFTGLTVYVGVQVVSLTATVVNEVSEVTSGFSTAEDARLSLVNKFTQAVPAGYQPTNQYGPCTTVNLDCTSISGELELSPSVPTDAACDVLLAYASATSDPNMLTTGPVPGSQVKGAPLESLRTLCREGVTRDHAQMLKAGRAAIILGGMATTPELKVAFESPSTILDDDVVRTAYMLAPAEDGGWVIAASWN